VKEVVVVGAARTPVGNFGGSLKDLSATQLGVIVAKEVIRRAGVDADIIDEVICGNAGMPMKEANVARQIALFAGLDDSVPAFSVQRNCASALQALTSAVQAIRAGDNEVILVVGTENMSMAPYEVYGARWGLRIRHGKFEDTLWNGLTDAFTNQLMGETAENLADKYDISRRAMDEHAVLSHQKAFRATRMGKFKDEIVPVEVPKKYGPAEPLVQDESPITGLSLERLSMAPAVFRENGRVTPGNSCPINDGAAAVLVMAAARAKELGLEPLAYVKSYAYAGVDPRIMGIGPVYSTEKALGRAELALNDIDLIELNEAFSAQYIACRMEMGFDESRVNVHGGGLALGHPIGATGLRMVNTLLYEMSREDLALGLVTMCVGGGQGGSVVFERK